MTTYVAGGRGVAAGRGWDWIAAGWELFKKQAGMWIGLFLVLLVILVAFSLTKILGFVASFVLTPVLGAGIFAAGRAADEGRPLEFAHLFAGFRERFTALVLLGVAFLAVAAVIALVVVLATGVSVLAVMNAAASGSLTPAAALSAILALLIMLALLLPAVMAIWFAPALVLFNGKGAIEALRDSFFGCLKNVVPFLVYGIVALVLGMLAAIPAGLGWLVLGPVLAASLYTSYKDIYLTA